MQVANCSTPASYFHILRRQIHRDFRKPLIIMTPKSLLRHKACVSNLDMFGPGSGFHRVLHEDNPPSKPKDCKQVVLCSGKVFYDLLEKRDAEKIKDVHIIRLEQLYPFPVDALLDELEPYKHCDLVWCQEEPRNMGYWSSVHEMLEEVAEMIGFKNPRPRYAGRRSAASPATGYAKRHAEEQAGLVADALTIGKAREGRIGTRRRYDDMKAQDEKAAE